MLNLKINKRASIPVTIFVIVVLVLLIVTLGAFAIDILSKGSEIKTGFEKVQEYNLKFQEGNFNGIPFIDGIRKTEKDYWVFGKETLTISVSRIP